MTDIKASSSQPTTAAPIAGRPAKRLGQISLVACLGGLLFGYDTGVANGAEGHMAQELGLNVFQLGVVISSLVFAAAVGALFAGRISDAIGRRKAIISLAVLFFIGSILVVFSPAGEMGQFYGPGFAVLVAGRIMLGLAVGGASTVVPVYLAELAPLEIRGSLTGRNELAIVSGQLAAFVINAIIAVTLHGVIDGIWRIMFAVCALPAVALFLGMLRMPESPRWLVNQGRYDDARRVMETVRTPERAKTEMDEIIAVHSENSAAFAKTKKADEKHTHMSIKEVLINKWLVRLLIAGIGVAVAQQLTGINAIMYYGTRVLEESGMSAEMAVVANIAFGVVAVIGGLIALRNMDRLDRRTTFIIGLSLTTSFHILIAIAGTLLPEGNAARPIAIMVLVVGFVLSMQTFLNVAVWVWLAEIFPVRMKGIGTGISVFFGWGVNGVLALFFPALVSGVGITFSFLIFAVVGVIALTFVAKFVPETRGRSLEELDHAIFSGQIFKKA
ncbi:sugar permease [Corynebacterium suranareeae]|uniref:Sugar permease n=1 Tax=Corynebacterium suranareeae TaxID=2506452 RepID=A0A169SC52_9CORY|nr:sugar porter family MFS transporter [Corynebacterium suranareeae]BAU97404.1 sugar permease [Corynebacterium suranareeae]